MLHTNLSVNEKGHLTMAGVDVVTMAEKYGTPLMLVDEQRVRENCRTYVRAMKEHFGGDSMPLFASKALCFKGLYQIVNEEGMGTDIVSPGELYTAKAAGFPLEKAYFHGNNKTDADIQFGIDAGIGYFIADNREELTEINRYAGEKGIRQKVILRVTPGIDPHTHAAISTGKVDSKFGTAIETGQALALIKEILTLPHIDLVGIHCHVGSLCFDSKPFLDAADIMIAFMAEIKAETGKELGVLNLGGGYGVRYIASNPTIDIAGNIKQVAAHVKEKCAQFGLALPQVLMEPGRSIVADAGLTLYTAGSVKTITGYKSYISIDGGMTDNPRYALYQSDYTVLNATRAADAPDMVATIAGRCCESGDLIQEDVKIKRPVRGDIIAVLVTGAYNYAMASNYNRIPRPAIVMLGCEDKRAPGADHDYVVVKRESYEDLVRYDV
ncbi:MAG: diaminopimelate decarboxylase [Clostridiales bacterium]|nr:diaminopimelate decarboxylase [Clostridiales bacterium]